MIRFIITTFFFSILSCANVKEKEIKTVINPAPKLVEVNEIKYSLDTNRLREKAKEALEYAKAHKMNTNYVLAP